MKLRALAVFAAIGFVACENPITLPPPPVSPSISTPTYQYLGAESTTVRLTANVPAMWRIRMRECSVSAYGDWTAAVGPSTEFSWTITGLRALTAYCIEVEARNGEAWVRLPDEFRTPDYEPCDIRNTTAPLVPITFIYRPSQPPSPYVLIGNVELLDCAGRLVNQPGDRMVSNDGGLTYTSPPTWMVRVNHPGGSLPHSFRALREDYRGGIHFDGWIEPPDIRINGVIPTAHSDSLPPRVPCNPNVGCLSGVRWYFSVDSLGVVRP